MSFDIAPLQDRILVKLVTVLNGHGPGNGDNDADDDNGGGGGTPPGQAENPFLGKVVAVGDGTPPGGGIARPMRPTVGDTVIFRGEGFEFTYEETKFRFIREDDVFAILTGPLQLEDQ